jgi:parallel beta-helix repeat protein
MTRIAHMSAAMLLLATLAHATTTVISAPQGNQGACPFPGCKSTAAGTDITESPFNVFPGPADMTGAIQSAIDSGAATLIWPAGTYTVCNLMPRAPNQRWVGAGPGQTILTGTPACNNLLVMSAAGIFGGPNQNLEITGFTFQGAVQAELLTQCRDMAAHLWIHGNAFDTGSVGCATGAIGISMAGCRDFVIEDNEFYSSCPGSGGRGLLLAGVRGGTIQRNRSNWQRTFLEIGSTANQPTEFTNISDNTYHGTFWGIPTKYTNSGATVSYAGGVLTDTAASFAGLCDQGGASPCAAAAGNFVRVLTAKVSGGTANFNTGGGMLFDGTGPNFVAAGVQRGDIVKTIPVCLGNGAKGPAARFVCTAAAGTAAWGDSCGCTVNADCASNVCEPRWATVDTVASTQLLQVDEWARDTACPLGSALCPPSTRRPTGALLLTAIPNYTIYGWAACQITSYTATTITCNSDGWFNWTGAAATPANTTLYEVMYSRPLYFLLAGSASAVTMTQGVRAVNNTVSGGFADHFELFSTQSVVVGNTSRDCGDTCYVISGSGNTVTGNTADHCGARGIILQGDDSTVTANSAWDSPWIRVSSTTTQGDLVANGNRNTFSANKVRGFTPTNLNRYGMVAFGNSDGNQWVNNTCGGTYTVGCYRFDGAASTNNHIVGYHGETISNNGGTFSLEGGLTTQALLTALAPQNGSYCGCSDCTTATACTAGGGGSIGFRTTGAWKCP